MDRLYVRALLWKKNCFTFLHILPITSYQTNPAESDLTEVNNAADSLAQPTNMIFSSISQSIPYPDSRIWNRMWIEWNLSQFVHTDHSTN